MCEEPWGGSDWYLGAITDENARTLDVPLSFLGKGKWMAQIYEDTPQTSYETSPETYQYREAEVSAKDVLSLKLATSGGCAIRFIKK